MGVFDRKIQFSWLENFTELILQGHSRMQINEVVNDFLSRELKGTAKGGAVDKTRRVLMRMWFHFENSAPDFLDFRKFLSTDQIGKRKTIYYGLAISSFSFFRGVAEVIGRLARLQSEFTTQQIQRRLCEEFGERELTRRAGQHVFRSMVEWGLLKETGKKGEYCLAEPIQIEDKDLALWMYEALLRSYPENDGIFLHDFQNHLSMFPFNLPNLTPFDLRQNPRLESFAQGINKEIVLLK